MKAAGTRYAQPELPFVKHSDTSVAAAEAAEEIAGGVRARVLLAIRHSGAAGLTDEELVERLRGNANTVRPRRIELRDAGLIRASGQRTTRSGRDCVVWVAADEVKP